MTLRSARVAVVGLGLSGRACLRVLSDHGTRVHGYDASETAAARAAVELPEIALTWEPDPLRLAETIVASGADVCLVSPGVAATSEFMRRLAEAGMECWSEVEAAWRLQVELGSRTPWLTLTGTNGKTTTVGMLSSMLSAAGLRAPAVGNVGTPVIEVVAGQEADVLAVELSSFQLHLTHTVAPQASACLNIAPDHLDWHGGFDAYWRDKAKVYERTRLACVYAVADEQTRRMVEGADVAEGARAIGVRLGPPSVGEVGVVEDVLCDRAFVPRRQVEAQVLAEVQDLAHLGGGRGPIPPHVVSNALTAAALARAHGVEAAAVRQGLRDHPGGPHRMEVVATTDDLTWIDDSKATNAHAARASIAAADAPVVWIAGGLAKGATFDDLVADVAGALRAVVLIGVDRAPLREALARHARQVPVVEIDSTETEGVMSRAVAQAARLAQAGDLVLLAPACASMDQFTDYGARGDAFARAVAEVRGSR